MMMGEEHDRLFARLAEAYGRAWAPRPSVAEPEHVAPTAELKPKARRRPKVKSDVILLPIAK